MVTSTVSRLGAAPEEGIKAPVVTATTVNITLSGLQTIDGVAVTTDDRVLVKDQTDAAENGIYLANANAWTRATDFNTSNDVAGGQVVVNANDSLMYQVVVTGVWTPDTTDINFTGLDPAATSAAAAAASETAAAASETAAAASETAAAASETAAAASFDSFDDRYLGSKSSAPTLDNDGDALLDGALYWNTTSDKMQVYDLGGTQWLDLFTGTNADTVDDLHAVDLLSGRKNRIINGDFDIWQRGTSQTIDGYDSDDRWENGHTGSTKVHSQQAFTIGQTTVPDSPINYSETVVTSVAGAGNRCRKGQFIEDVRKLAGKTVTLSFWAKADSAKDIATEFSQGFGSGGSPSVSVTAIGVTTHSLTTSWQKFTATVDIPSISGKTLGTDENSSSTAIFFWFDAGSNFDARTNTLGQQSGTFDIAKVQIEEGSIATNFEFRPIAEELALCQRYYWKSFPTDVAPAQNAGVPGSLSLVASSSGDWRMSHTLPVVMRADPATVLYNPSANNAYARNVDDNTDDSNAVIAGSTTMEKIITVTSSGSAADGNDIMAIHVVADAEI